MKGFLPTFRKSFTLAVAMVFSAMLWSESANAQTFPKHGVDNWKTTDLATSTLNNEIAVLDGQLQSGYNQQLDYKRKFFNNIVFSIEQGNTVPNALNESYILFAPASDVATSPQTQPTVANPLSVDVWHTFYQDAIILLEDN